MQTYRQHFFPYRKNHSPVAAVFLTILSLPYVRRLLYILLAASSSAAQAQLPGAGVEITAMPSRLLRHTAKMTVEPAPFSFSTELAYMQQTNGHRAWHAAWGFPRVGFSALWAAYDAGGTPRPTYGSCFSLYPTLELRALSTPRLDWTVRMGAGLGWATEPYRRDRGAGSNTLNTAVGSRVNASILFFTGLRYAVAPRWSAAVGLAATHISNAAARQPNLGINTVGPYFTAGYYPGGGSTRPERSAASTPDTLPRRLRFTGAVRYGMAFNETGHADGPQYPAYLAAAWGGRRWNRWQRTFVGVDASYHKSIEAFLKATETAPGREAAESWRGGVFVGHEALLGRVGIVGQLGAYVRQAELRADPLYQRVGLHVYALQRTRGDRLDLFGGLLLKTHRTQAELAEFAVGVGW